MATSNGDLSQALENASSPAGTKRKRSESQSEPDKSNTRPEGIISATSRVSSDNGTFQDVVEVLQRRVAPFRKPSRHDPTPSILNYESPQGTEDGNTDKHSAKRAKLADKLEPESIITKVRNESYSTIHQLEKDISKACAARIADIRAKDGAAEDGHVASLDAADIKVIESVADFESLAKDLFSRDAKRTKASKDLQGQVNGVKQEEASAEVPGHARNSRTVLSLFGNAPNPRQLFSSLQVPENRKEGTLPAHGSRDAVALEELGLPSMLTASKVLPLPSDSLKKLASKSTFGDVFAPPASLPQLYPPKANKQLSTRSGSISFTPGEALPKPSTRKNAYTAQPLPTGEWLAYGYADLASSAASPAVNRKNRDQPPSVQEELGADNAGEEEALFRAAFSSFAPCHDDSKALVSEETKNMVWWRRAGQQRFDNRFVLDPELEQSTATLTETNKVTNGEVESEEANQFQKAIEKFDQESMEASALDQSIPHQDVTVEELLKDISDLLQTLLSHQRIRHSHIVSQSRTPASPSPLLSSLIGTPTEPSEEETSTYKTLRSQLAEMIDKLPPYAVAKLNGEQLEELRVSKTILIENRSYRGTLEEDQLTRMARSAAAAAAAGTNRPTSGASQYGSTSGQYGRTSSFSQSTNRQSYYGSTRTPAPTYGRTTSYGTPATAPPRQSYTQMGSYATGQANRQAPAPSYGQGSQYYNRATTYGQQYGGQASPQAQSQVRGSNTPMYGARSQNVTAFAQNGATGAYGARSTSPAKLTLAQGGQLYAQAQAQARAANSSMPAVANGQQPGSGRATPTNNAPQTQTPSALGPSGFHTSMTSEQQQMMMERQRLQLALQPQARLAAQAEVRQGSGTPQPAPTNGVPSDGDGSRLMVA